METVGVVGLGLMGKPMVRRLLAHGFRVAVFNRSAPAMDELGREGALPQRSAKAVAEASDAVITMLPDGPDVAAVMRGPEGIFVGALPGRLAIDMSSIAPATAIELAQKARTRGLGFLDAPVSGGPEGASGGTLSIMVGGDPADVARAMPIFNVLGSTVTHCGPSGSGQIVKACNQLVVALNIEAVAEALVLAERAGVDPRTVVRVLGGGLAASRVLALRGEAMAARDFAPRGKARSHKKDLGIILDLARRNDVVLPATAVVDQLFTALLAHGRGDWDHTAVMSIIDDLSAPPR